MAANSLSVLHCLHLMLVLLLLQGEGRQMEKDLCDASCPDSPPPDVPYQRGVRESLERRRLKFSLGGGKVTALCPQEGEQVWALNIKRALLSMLQTSHTASKQEIDKETVDSKLQCAQRMHGTRVMAEVNCTETVSMVTGRAATGPLKTQTLSTLSLLRAQPDKPSGLESLGPGVRTDLVFDQEGGGRRSPLSTRQQASESVSTLCGLTQHQQQMSQRFLQLVFQLRDLSLSQLKTLWLESSFNCRDDWQPLLSALGACGSESCVLLLTELMQKGDLEPEQAQSYLAAIALTPHPSPLIVDSINALLGVPELRSRALLAGSSVVHALCRRSSSPCVRLPQVQTFVQTLQDSLGAGCEGEEPARVSELLYVLKAVGNSGLSAAALVATLSRCALASSGATELRLAAVHAFRRMPCTADRTVLLQLYRSSREDAEVRVAAYQQLMRCPDPGTLRAVRTTLGNETSGQVGSYVWSHLTALQRTEDPMKQSLVKALTNDIISKDFEADFWKYSSYSDYTVATGMGIANLEGSLVFSPESFVPRSASANLTVYLHGRAHNLLEVDLRMENAEPLLKNLFAGHPSRGSEREAGGGNTGGRSQSRKAGGGGRSRRKRRASEDDDEDRGGREACSSSSISSYLDRAKAMLTGRRRASEDTPRCWVGVKVFGNEINAFTCDDLHSQLSQLSLSVTGLAVKLLKGQEVQLSHRAVLMAEELALPSLSGMPVRLAVNVTALLSLRLKGNVNYRDTGHFSLAGFIKPSAFVGLSGWMGVDGALGQAGMEWASELSTSTGLDGSVQLQEGRDLRVCSNASYPLPAAGAWLPPPGPAHLSRGWWLPREASLHLLLATPRSSIPRDMSLDLVLHPQRLLLKASVDTKTLLSEQRSRYHLEAKLAPGRPPMMLSANITRGLARKISFSAAVKNVFRDTLTVLVALERRLEESGRRYSVEGEVLLPGVLGSRVLGLMEEKTPLWSSALRFKYGVGEQARQLRQECYTSQSLRRETTSDLSYTLRAEHEFYCSNTASVNHKVVVRHEESPSHARSSVDTSYGRHWDEVNNKHKIHLSQSFKNQSTQNHTSYTLEFSLQVPEKHLSYRTQLLHSHLRERSSEGSTHLKVSYNDLMPLVAGLQWRSPAHDAPQKKWEGTFNMDTPWLYIFMAHKLSRPQSHTLQLSAELTARKWLTVRGLALEALYKDRGREKEARLHLYTPVLTYVKAGGWGVVGKHGVKTSWTFSSVWTLALRGQLSLEGSRDHRGLQLVSSYGRQNLSLSVAFTTLDKVRRRVLVVLPDIE
ncbi:hypothetical protein CRUP_033369 [Coryphaenoides rupestris]|nr:hypothetical protein CRUP_033369 [Coryphaenoides rupestris]